MAEMTIRLVIDPDTGKKNIIVAYQSDDDAMPMEHEDEHRRLVNRLIEGGAVTAAELGKIVVERDTGEARVQESAEPEIAVERRSVAHET